MECDIVVVGGGHHGLITANYLVRSGLEVVVVERRHEVGGAADTEEPIPGFLMNLHAFFVGHSSWPWYWDLELYKFGAFTISPPVSTSTIFSDHKCLILYANNLKKTLKSVGDISPEDVKSWKRFYETHYPLIDPGLIGLEDYCVPIPESERVDLLEKSELGQTYLQFITSSPIDWLRETFEEPRIHAALVADWSGGSGWHDMPDRRGRNFKVFFARQKTRAMIKGGTHQLAHALFKAFHYAGGFAIQRGHVTRVIVEDGVAKGVELADGTRIMARKGVVSAVDPWQTFLKFIDEKYLDADLIKKIKKLRPSKRAVLFQLYLALNTPPKYKAAEYNPDVNDTLALWIGYDSVEDVEKNWRDNENGIPPGMPGSESSPAFEIAHPTVHDPNQAPPGKHTAFAWQFAPYNLKDGGPFKWRELEEEYAQICLDRWREYAPNLGGDNIIGINTYTPLGVEEKLVNMRRGNWGILDPIPEQTFDCRPTEELAQYRTPIKNLWVTGAAYHPGGALHGAAGYNTARVVAEDLGIDLWWNPPNLRELYLGLKDFEYQKKLKNVMRAFNRPF
jgi:phytoene dehydrogenase-like protein